MMTRKDYVETAKILNSFIDRIDSHDFNDLVFEFSEWFASDNPRFLSDKFEEACYVTEQIYHFPNSISLMASNNLCNSFRNQKQKGKQIMEALLILPLIPFIAIALIVFGEF